MDIKLSKEITDLDIAPSDVKHMLKACNQERSHAYKDVYEPTLEELKEVLLSAYDAEIKRNRPVVKWSNLISKLNK